jgi:predicted RNase H-like HicB family nuclease
MTVKVVIEQGEDGYFAAHCPSLKSCWSQGRTREEAIANIREAIELYLEPSAQDLVENQNKELVAITI